MRRLLAVAALVTVLAAVSGCSADRPAGEGTAVPTAAGPGATSAGSTGTPSTGDAQVCAESQRAGTSAVRVYVEELGRMVAAVGAGDSATAETARVRAEAALAQWRTTLREQAARAADPQLRTLLTDMGAEVAALGVDGGSIDETELDRLQQRLDQLCVR
ncbi:hypothetical protein [Micromonospora profundi]|uniref:hypothetical protein n=1 Tax=Micromonospora profundi TaxID=1420889 RepID=UPI003655A268